MRVLLVEDDDTIARATQAACAEAGFLVVAETDGQAALTTGRTPDLAAIILDLGLPGLDGTSILKVWREEGLRTPVLILTARGSWLERVHGIEAGADDYLSKPFHMRELIARLRALVRRTSSLPYATRLAHDIVVDTQKMRAVVRGRAVALTPHEFRALSFLVARRGHVVSVSELVRNVKGDKDAVTPNAIEALIGRIRRKMGSDVIETKRGFGYIIPDEQV